LRKRPISIRAKPRLAILGRLDSGVLAGMAARCLAHVGRVCLSVSFFYTRNLASNLPIFSENQGIKM
jgi:hypothetical protein